MVRAIVEPGVHGNQAASLLLSVRNKLRCRGFQIEILFQQTAYTPTLATPFESAMLGDQSITQMLEFCKRRFSKAGLQHFSLKRGKNR